MHGKREYFWFVFKDLGGAIPLVNTPDDVVLHDVYGRPAGILVSEALRLAAFQAWGVGTHTLKPSASEFAATVVFPCPEPGVRGVLLDDGTLLEGDVWLVGDEGVVFRHEEMFLPASCGLPERRVSVIRMDVVGDPLFRRRLCQGGALFATPSFIKSLRFVGPNQTIDTVPDAQGNLLLAANNNLAEDSVLRIVTTPDGLVITAVGQPSDF